MKLRVRNFIETEHGPVELKDMDPEALEKWRENARARIEKSLNTYYSVHQEEYQKLCEGLG